MNDLRTIVNNLKSLKERFRNDTEMTGEQVITAVHMADSFIRSYEILLRLNEYEKEKFYFGYLLIQAQRIEQTLKGIILGLNKNKVNKGTAVLISEDDLNIPLGALVTELGKYIRSDFIFTELGKFKDFRNKIIHRINDDYSVTLYELENSILEEYDINKINNLQALLLKIYDIPEISPSVKALKDIIKEYNIEDIKIEIL